MKVKSESEVSQSCLTLATPWAAAYQAPPSMGFSRQEYWSGVPSPSPYLRLVSCSSVSWISPHPGCTVGPLQWVMAWRPQHPLFTYMAGSKSSMWARYVLFFFFWPHQGACGILVPQPGIKPSLPALGAPSLNHWTARECFSTKSLQSCPTLCDHKDYSLKVSSLHGVFQARILEWVAISFSRGSSRPRDRTCVCHVSCVDKHVLHH